MRSRDVNNNDTAGDINLGLGVAKPTNSGELTVSKVFDGNSNLFGTPFGYRDGYYFAEVIANPINTFSIMSRAGLTNPDGACSEVLGYPRLTTTINSQRTIFSVSAIHRLKCEYFAN